LRKIKDCRFRSLHCACKVEGQRRDEPSAVHIETGHLLDWGRPRRSVGERSFARYEMQILHASRANHAYTLPLGDLDPPARTAAPLRRFDRVGVGKRCPAARPRLGRRPLERHVEEVGTKQSFADLRISGRA
jgi:hypothetical protein